MMKKGFTPHRNTPINRSRTTLIGKSDIFHCPSCYPVGTGFTLIELLIVILILVTIMGLGMASFNSFNRRERLKQSGLTLRSNLRFSQTKAISAQKPASGCTTYVGMRISFTQTSYSAQHECDPEGLVGNAESTTLPSGITFLSVPADFTFLTRTNTASIATDVTITLTNQDQNYALTISPSGNIRDVGFQ